MFLYEGHLGSIYLSDTKYYDLYCSQCGDSDRFLGKVNNWKEMINAIGIKNIQVFGFEGGWADDYIFEVAREMDKTLSKEEFYNYLRTEKVKTAFNGLFSDEAEDKYFRDSCNEILIREFPFLKNDSYISDDYIEFTWLDDIPTGWKKAFGLNFLYELKNALIKDNSLKKFQFDQIKEKYGTLQIYSHGHGKNTEEVLSRYEKLSKNFCINCGKKATLISQNYICPWCNKCSKEIHDTFKNINDALN